MNISEKLRTLIVIVGTSGLVGLTSAFEIDTHATITQEAYKRSNLYGTTERNSKLISLGLFSSRESGVPSPRSAYEILLGSSYFDMSIAPAFRRESFRYDHFYGTEAPRTINRWEPVAKYKGVNAPFLADWLSRGAVREDDAAGIIRALKYREQPNDAPGRINRYCNHFYDPIPTNTAALNNAGIGASFFCSVAPDDAVKWGLGTLGARGEGGEDTARTNRFTLRDAREAQWRALTMRDKAMTQLPLLGMQPRAFRDAYWATTFRALGSVMHLAQDMGNPQYTRNAS
jgi:hypothetical protein